MEDKAMNDLCNQLHQYEDVINMELRYQKTTKEIVEQFYNQNQDDFSLTKDEINVLTKLIENYKEENI